MKKLINDPRAVVDESVDGFGLAHADLVTVNAEPRFITRKDAPVAGKVGLVSGGGSGHEPLHAGFVGHGNARRRRAGGGVHLTDAGPDPSGDARQSTPVPASSISSRTTPATS